MRSIELDYGTKRMPVELPDSAVVVRYGKTYADPPSVDPVAATRAALDAPLGLPPLTELAGPGRTAVIVFPDRVKGGAHPLAHRRVSIPAVVDDLLRGGCRIEDISLLCAQGLHRRNTREEWLEYLGPQIVDRFWPDRISNHDAEGDRLLDLGHDGMGNAVQTHRAILDADIAVLIGHCAANPYGGFSGGYKMLVTGLAGRASIASHHNPTRCIGTIGSEGPSTHTCVTSSSPSVKPSRRASASGSSRSMRCLGSSARSSTSGGHDRGGRARHVAAGEAPRRGGDRRTRATRGHPDRGAAARLPLWTWHGYQPDPHEPGDRSPVLARREGVATRSGHHRGRRVRWLVQCRLVPLVRRVVRGAPGLRHGARLPRVGGRRAISTDPTYCASYSSGYTYHPFHAMSMISGGAVPLRWCSQVYVVGAEQPRYARGMGFRTLRTVAGALTDAERYVGSRPRILATPECYSGGMAVNLIATGAY